MADADGVLGHAVENVRVAREPALIAERVRNVFNPDIIGVRKQGPKEDAGIGGDRAIETHKTRKSR